MRRNRLLLVSLVVGACSSGGTPADSGSESTSSNTSSGSATSASATTSSAAHNHGASSGAATATAGSTSATSSGGLAGTSSSSSGGTVCAAWDFSGDVAPWTLDHDLAPDGAQPTDGVRLVATGGDPYLSVTAGADLEACDLLEVTLAATPAGGGGAAQVFWLRADDTGYFNEAQSRFFALQHDGNLVHRVDLSAHPLWNGTLRALRLDPFNDSGALVLHRVALRSSAPVATSSSAAASSSSAAATSSSSTGGACATPLANRLTVTAVSDTDTIVVGDNSSWAGNRPVHLAPLATGSKVAWSSDDGNSHVTTLDDNDARVGPDLVIVGESVRGFVAHADGTVALLVVRGDDVVFVKLDTAGTVLAEALLIGDQPQEESGAKWVNHWGQQGRMVFHGDEYTVYLGHTQNFGPELGNHQGDLLYALDANGVFAGAWWHWGCSHSLDVRLAYSGDDVGAVCLSDSYPQKAINFNHGTELRAEPSGTANGYTKARLGGWTALPAGGFALTFLSEEGRCPAPNPDGTCPEDTSARDVGFLRTDVDGTVLTTSWLTTTPGAHEDGAHLAPYGAGLLAAWKAADGVHLATVDQDGTVGETDIVNIVDFAHRDDFATHPDGAVGWGFSPGTGLSIARIRTCP